MNLILRMSSGPDNFKLHDLTLAFFNLECPRIIDCHQHLNCKQILNSHAYIFVSDSETITKPCTFNKNPNLDRKS